jgi:hypothetical protein
MFQKPVRQLARNAGKQFTGLKSAKNVIAREEDYDVEDEVLYQDLTAPDGFATHGATRAGGGFGGVVRSFGKQTLAPAALAPSPSCPSTLAFSFDIFRREDAGGPRIVTRRSSRRRRRAVPRSGEFCGVGHNC